MNKLKGFSLIELAIVLVIVGLVAGAGLGVTNGQIQSARISNTKQKQEAIRLALINFISRNNRLPCPAVANLAQGAAGYGTEASTPGTCTSTTINGAVSTGIVPWVSLGLSDENGTDGYYNRFTYQVVLAATNASIKTISYVRGAISTHTGTPVVLGAPTIGNQSNDCTAGGAFNPCAALVVIVSHGNNGSGAYTTDGTRIPLPTGADEIENTNSDNKFVIKDYSTNAANPFDDIVLPLSSADLLSALTINGSVKDYTAFINEDVTNIKNAVIAYAVKNRTGGAGTGSYPVPVNTQLLTALGTTSMPLDPWGKSYIYTNTLTNSVTAGTNGTTILFSLQSYGADGVASSDDIITTISASQLQDAFSKAGW